MGLTKGWFACWAFQQYDLKLPKLTSVKHNEQKPKFLVQSKLLRPAKVKINMVGNRRLMIARFLSDCPLSKKLVDETVVYVKPHHVYKLK